MTDQLIPISHRNGRRRHQLLLVFLLVVLTAGCAGKAPQVGEPGAQTPQLDRRRAQLAYHYFADGSLKFSLGNYSQAAESYERALRHDPGSYEVRLSLAECYFRTRQFARAVSVADVISPKDSRVYDLLGRAYIFMDQVDDAREAYVELLETDSTNAQAFWNLYRLAMRRGYLDEAALHLEKLSKQRPATRVFNDLGNLYIRLGQPRDAAGAFEHSLDRDSTESNRRALIGLAGALEAEERFAEAISVYERAIAQLPDDLQTRKRLLMLQIRTDRLDDAIATIDSILTLYPADQERIRLGFLLYDTEQYDRAESLFVAMAERDGEDKYLGLFYLGRISGARDNPDAAKEYFRRATVVTDSIPDAWIHWGNVLASEDSLDAAVVIAKRGMEVVHDPEPFWYFIGLTYSRGERYDSAAVWLQKSWQADTTDGRAQFSLAAALERAGRFPEAAVLFRGLISREPNNAGALNYLGYMFADSGVHLDESLDMIERAIGHDPDNGAYLDSFGWILYRLGRYTEAETQIRRALDILKSDSTIFDHLGDILAATGRRREAKEQWRRALELDPKNDSLQLKLQE
jgi:tetratricopeptide (TPR) repeat protein